MHVYFLYFIILQRLTLVQNNVLVLAVLLYKLWPKLDIEVSLD